MKQGAGESYSASSLEPCLIIPCVPLCDCSHAIVSGHPSNNCGATPELMPPIRVRRMQSRRGSIPAVQCALRKLVSSCHAVCGAARRASDGWVKALVVCWSGGDAAGSYSARWPSLVGGLIARRHTFNREHTQLQRGGATCLLTRHQLARWPLGYSYGNDAKTQALGEQTAGCRRR